MNREELKVAREEQLQLFAKVFDSHEGRKVLDVMKGWVRYDLPVFTAMDGTGRVDTHRAAWLDGRRSVYQEILSMLEQADDSADFTLDKTNNHVPEKR